MNLQLPHAIEVLQSTPATLSAMLSGHDEVWTKSNEGPGTFSPFDIVGHLIDGEETDWIPRAKIILAQGESVRFQPYDRFRHKDRNKGRSVEDLLVEFAELRSANLALLASWNLTDRQLDLEGEHPAFGRVTLRQLLSTWVVHDLGHIAQAARVMTKQYKHAVGPWKEYLPVLDER